MWVDTDNDADFSDETGLLGQFVTGAVGYVGVYRGAEGSTVQQFDDFKLGTDNSSPKDGDFADAGDEIAIDDNFNSAAISLAYDNNGNLTDDGIFAFVYDAWNRMVKAKHRSASNAATIGTYAYDGAMRRTKKVVTNQGPEATANDGGNTTVVFGYDNKWRMVEDRNASNQTLRQYLAGTRYTDEYIWIESNGDPTASNNSTPDVTLSGEHSESPADIRYFVHQDRNWATVGITEYSAAGGTSANTVERYQYCSYGDYCVLRSVGNYYELSRTQSIALSPFLYQGLIWNHEIYTFHNRRREYSPGQSRYINRDPAGFVDGLNQYNHVNNQPNSKNDPLGLGLLSGEVCINENCADMLDQILVIPERQPPPTFTPTSTGCFSADGTIFGGNVYKVPNQCTLTIDCASGRPVATCSCSWGSCTRCDQGFTICECKCVSGHWNSQSNPDGHCRKYWICDVWDCRPDPPFDIDGEMCGDYPGDRCRPL